MAALGPIFYNPPMIYIDVSAAVHSRAGLGRYSACLARAVYEQAPGRVALFHNLGPDGRLPAALAHLPRRQVRLGYKPWRLLVWLAHLSHLSLQRLVPDVHLFHSTEHLLFPLPHTPTVLTVHDLIFKLFPAYHKKLNYYYLNWAMPLFCRRATALIAISQASKEDVVRHYGLPPAKVHVIYEAAAAHFQPPPAGHITQARQHYQLPAHFLLHLGTIEPRKNLNRLLDALLSLRRDFPDLHLVLVGAHGWLNEAFLARLAAPDLAGWVHTLGWVPDEDLPAIIAAADLVVQPSLYEGFGLPVLEALACGQVVAASHASSLPEVGGEAAAYFDPTHVEEMALVVGRLLRDRAEYHHRQTLGLAQARQFSWERAGRETWALYEQLLAAS